MRKSNYLILGILVVASIFFLWMWYALNFNLVDNPLDLVLTIVWWAVVGLVILGITMAEKKRKEQIRTTFVARGFVFNPEMGTISLEGSSPVATIQNVITKLVSMVLIYKICLRQSMIALFVPPSLRMMVIREKVK